jgi:hypothetical protein
MESGWVIVSALCPSFKAFKHILPILQSNGFYIVALEEPLTNCVRDLLFVLQVTSLPAVRDSAALYCGRDAFAWAREHGHEFNNDPNADEGTSVNQLLTLIAEKRLGPKHSQGFCEGDSGEQG